MTTFIFHLLKRALKFITIIFYRGNIPENDITKGETLVEYLQPFPPKGTGYQRLIFVLYKQEKQIDFSSFKRDGLW